MNDHQTPFDLEQVELKTDVQVHRNQDYDPPQNSSGKAWPVVVLLGLLALGGCGAAAYYFTRFQEVREDFIQLQKEIDSASKSLFTTSGSLEETRAALSKSQTAIQRMSDELDNRKRDIERLKKSRSQLEKDLSNKTKSLEITQKSIKTVNAKNEALEKQTTTLISERDQLSQSMALQKKDNTNRIQDLNAALETSQAQATAQTQSYRQETRKHQSEKSALEAEVDRLKRQAESESQAGKAIIRERGQLKSANERLKLELAKSGTDLTKTQQQLQRLATTETGDLVIFSDEISPAEVRLRAPLPEGVRLPRSLGQVIVMALINENGGIEKAFLLRHQDLDGILARDIIATIYKWKFRPAQKGNTRVKVWQPIVFRP